MSVVTKGEKGTKKFQSLNINNLYQGSALKPLQKSIPQKHGLQSLGKVPTARRAPANLPSLKAEHSGNDPTINLVPSSHGLTGGGWNSKEEPDAQKANKKGDSTSLPSSAAVTANASSSAPQPAANSAANSSLSSKSTWGAAAAAASASASNNAPAAPGSAFRSPLFGQDFPSLTGNAEGSALAADPNGPSPPPAGHSKAESKYGPGPSLRPQSFATWSFGGGKQQSNHHDGSKDAHHHHQDKFESRARTVESGGGLKFDVGVNSPLLQQGAAPPSFASSGRKSTPMRSQPPVLVNKPTHQPPQQQSRPRDKVFQGSIIDNEKLKRMDDIDSTDDDWTKRDESFDYNKKIASDDEDDYPTNERGHNNWTDQLANRHSEPKDNYNEPKPSYPQMGGGGAGRGAGLKVDSHLSFLDDEDQRRTKKNEEVLKNIERARRRRAEEEQKYRVVDDYGQYSNEYHNRRNSPATSYENGVSKSSSGNAPFGKFDVGGATTESDDYDSEPKKPATTDAPPLQQQQPSRPPKQSSVPPRFKRHGVELHSYKRVSPPKEQRGQQHFEDNAADRSSASRDSADSSQPPVEKDYGALFRQSSTGGAPNNASSSGWGMRHQSGSSDNRMQSEDKFDEQANHAEESDKKMALDHEDDGGHFARGSGGRLSNKRNNKHEDSSSKQHKKALESGSTKDQHRLRGEPPAKQQQSASSSSSQQQQKGERGQQRGSQRGGGHNALVPKENTKRGGGEPKSSRGSRQQPRKDEEPAEAVHGQKQNRQEQQQPPEEAASPSSFEAPPSGEIEKIGWFAPRGQPSRRGRGGLITAGESRGQELKGDHQSSRGHKHHNEDWDETSSELSAGQNEDRNKEHRRGGAHGRREKNAGKKATGGKSNEHGDDHHDGEAASRNNRRSGDRVRKHDDNKEGRRSAQPERGDRRGDRSDRGGDRDKQSTYERRQNKLPPRLAKQKEQNRFSGGAHVNHGDAWGAAPNAEVDIPPPVGGGVPWDHQVLSHAPYGLSSIQQQQVNIEFDRAMLMHRFRNNDDGSAADSLTSGLSSKNMGDAFAAASSESRENAVQTIIFENTNFKGRPPPPPSSASAGEGDKLMFKLSAANAEKAGLGFGQAKVEDDLKLDFTFETDDISGHGDDKAEKATRVVVPASSGVSSVSSVSQPASAEDLNMKIASVKKVWETLPSMSPVPVVGADFSSEEKSFEQNNGFIDKDSNGPSNLGKVRPQGPPQGPQQQQQSSHHHQAQQPLQQQVHLQQHQVVQQQLQHVHQSLLHQQQASGLDDRMMGRGGNNINYNRLLGSSGLANLQSPPSILGQQPSLYQAFQIDPSRGVTNQLYSYPPTGMGGQSLIMPPSGGAGSGMSGNGGGGNSDIFASNNQFGRQFTGPPPNASQPSTVAGLMSGSMSNAMKQSVVTSGIGPIGTKMNAYQQQQQQQSGLGGSGTSPLLIQYDGGAFGAMQRSAAGQTAFYQALASSSRQNNFGMYPNQQSLVQQQMMRNAVPIGGNPYAMKPDVSKSSGGQPHQQRNDPYGNLQARQFANNGPQQQQQQHQQQQQQQAAVKATAVSMASMSLRVGSSAATNGNNVPASSTAAAVQPSTSYSPTPIQRPPGGKGKQVLSSDASDEAPVTIDSGLKEAKMDENDE